MSVEQVLTVAVTDVFLVNKTPLLSNYPGAPHYDATVVITYSRRPQKPTPVHRLDGVATSRSAWKCRSERPIVPEAAGLSCDGRISLAPSRMSQVVFLTSECTRRLDKRHTRRHMPRGQRSGMVSVVYEC